MRTFFAPAAALLITGVSYLGLFQRETVLGVTGEAQPCGEGYAPARTPQEALERFREAVGRRDYEGAADYCEGDFAGQLHQAAPAARAVGEAIDNLRQEMDRAGVTSDRVRRLLELLEPFPRRLKVAVLVTKRDEGRAYAKLGEGDRRSAGTDGCLAGWRLDPRCVHPLSRGIPNVVELRRITGNGEVRWEIFIPVTPQWRLGVAYLTENTSAYVRALDRARAALESGPDTRFDLERDLLEELESVGK